MWYSPPSYHKEVKDFNQELKAMKGEFDQHTAKVTLGKFFYRNIGFAVDFLTGIKLFPDQIVLIKGMLQSKYSLCVLSRGLGKTYSAAVFCFLQAIFFPNSNILIAGPTFRTSRFIFDKLEEIVESPKGKFLAQCMGVKSRKNDLYSWKLSNGSKIVAIPLNGEKVRGFRANVLLIDEFLLMGEDIVEKVLMPFIVVPQDMDKRQIIRSAEDRLIRSGRMTEEQREVFIDRSKFIGLSSASYTCEYLARKYDEFFKKIYEPPKDEPEAKYFIAQMSFNSVVKWEDRMEKSVIASSQSNEGNQATFKREYGAQFIDGSDSYFSMNKMIACTVPDGEMPSILLKGIKGRKYLLAIDPDAGGSERGDHFAMSVIEMDETVSVDRKYGGTLVHCYAKAGQDLKDNIKYFYYILKSFNIQMIITDHAGHQFIEAANESDLFRRDGLDIKIFDFCAEKEGAELEEELKKALRCYNKSNQVIAFTQVFTVDSIRKMNEHLQTCIDFKKIWFGSLLKAANEAAFNRAVESNPDLFLVGEESTNDFIDTQEALIKLTKFECASIEVKSTAKGTQSFDLPTIMKRDNTAKRMRKDSYTSLMLGCWLMKAFFDIHATPMDSDATFAPMMN